MAEAPRDFQAGRPLREELTAARLNATLAAIRRNKPLPGRGISVTETGAGTRIDLAPLSTRRAFSSVSPFTVLLRPVSPSDKSSPMEAGVVYRSRLFRSIVPDTLQIITGLLTEDDPEEIDDGWFSISDGDFVWLEVEFDEDGEPTGASIEHGEAAFDPSALPWESNSILEDDGETPPLQTIARKLLAYYNDGALTQCVDRDQVLLDCIINGRAARYPFDHSGGYVPPE